MIFEGYMKFQRKEVLTLSKLISSTLKAQFSGLDEKERIRVLVHFHAQVRL